MLDDRTKDAPPHHGIQELPHTLRAAAEIVRELRANPLLSRLIAAFSAMPLSDRPVVLEALEAEVQARRLSLATEDVTGQSMCPSPNARLYLRVHETDTPRLPFDRDDMMLAMLRGMRASTLLVDTLHETWLEASKEALGHLDAGRRTAVATLLRELLQLCDAFDPLAE